MSSLVVLLEGRPAVHRQLAADSEISPSLLVPCGSGKFTSSFSCMTELITPSKRPRPCMDARDGLLD